MSAHAMHHDIEKSLQAAFFRYLTKPTRIDNLMEARDSALTPAQAGTPFTNPP